MTEGVRIPSSFIEAALTPQPGRGVAVIVKLEQVKAPATATSTPVVLLNPEASILAVDIVEAPGSLQYAVAAV